MADNFNIPKTTNTPAVAYIMVPNLAEDIHATAAGPALEHTLSRTASEYPSTSVEGSNHLRRHGTDINDLGKQATRNPRNPLPPLYRAFKPVEEEVDIEALLAKKPQRWSLQGQRTHNQSLAEKLEAKKPEEKNLEAKNLETVKTELRQSKVVFNLAVVRPGTRRDDMSTDLQPAPKQTWADEPVGNNL
jgi:hypothetical protein